MNRFRGEELLAISASSAFVWIGTAEELDHALVIIVKGPESGVYWTSEDRNDPEVRSAKLHFLESKKGTYAS